MVSSQYRYKILSSIDKLRNINISRCVHCGAKLTEEEEKYYSCACEKCEAKYTRKLEK